jgi:hypothetical protein
MNRPVEVLLHHLPAVARSTRKWDADFARSVLRQSRRRSWKPTPKQLGVMQRMVGELFNEDDIDVIED